MKVGLVLGAGGATGGAFHAGVLAGLEEALGWDARTAEIVIGTSAGSMTGAALRAGLASVDLLARATGRQLSSEGRRLVASLPAPPSSFPLRLGNGRRVRSIRPPAAATLARMALSGARPLAMASAFLPPGQIPIADMAAGFDPLFRGQWPKRTFWVCAVRLSDARRVVFGRDKGTRSVPVATAVAASCAIPGFFAPVEVDGVEHVDGGVHSPSSLDLAGGLGLDLVLVSSPMSMAGRGVWRRTDFPLRRAVRGFLDQEAMRVRRRGTSVVAFQPTEEDAAVMGLNAMDARRRGAVADRAFESTRKRLTRDDVRRRLEPLTS